MLSKGALKLSVLAVLVCIFMPVLAHAKTIPVRFGLHPKYNRVVFDYKPSGNAKIDYKMKQAGNKISVTFPAGTTFSAKAFNSKFYPLIDRVENAAPTYIIHMREGAKVRDFVNEGSVVIDVTASGKLGPAKPSSSPASAAPTSSKKVAVKPVEKKQTAPSKPAPQSTLKTSKIADKVPADVKEEAILKAPKEAPKTNEKLAEKPTKKSAELKPESKPEPESELESALEPGSIAAPLNEPLKIRVPDTANGGFIPITITQDDNTVRMEFNTAPKSSIAVFERYGIYYITFDQTGVFTLDENSTIRDKLISDLIQTPADGGSVLQLRTVAGLNPTVVKNGTRWVVTYRPSPSAPDVDITPKRQPTYATGPRILLAIDAVGKVVSFTDPYIGDAILVGTTELLGRGVSQAYSFIDFDLLPTIQGVAMSRKSETTVLKAEEKGFAVTDIRGLRFTDLTKIKAAQNDNRIRLYRFQDWRQDELEGGNFFKTENALTAATVTKNESAQHSARDDLAKFYFANGLYADAIAVYDVMAEKDATFYNKPETLAIAGAAFFMGRDYEKARKYLLDPRLDSYFETAVWRGALAAAKGDYIPANEQFAEAGSIPGVWPFSMREKVTMLAANAALATDQFDQAGRIIQGFEQSLSADEFDHVSKSGILNYMLARVDLARGDRDGAKKSFAKTANSVDQFVNTRARLALLRMQQADEEITPEESVEALEKLKFAWRDPPGTAPDLMGYEIGGTPFEFDVLRSLGQAYTDNKQYREALVTLRDAIAYYADNEDTTVLADMMAKIYEDVFLNGKANELPPLKALGLFYEFRELTPVDASGDQMIASLANKLVKVDLLENAIELLQFQVENRLKGLEKAQTGSRLALIQLLNEQPEDALKSLEVSAIKEMPEPLEQERNLLKARALFELKQADKAIDVLYNDVSHTADLLRADIFWRTQNWDMAARTLKRLIDKSQESLREKRTLNKENELRELILNLAVAYALSDQEDLLKQLRTRYSRTMMGTSYEDLFTLITDTTIDSDATKAGVSKFDDLSKHFAKIDLFARFMDSFRSRLEDGKLNDLYRYDDGL